MAKKIEQNPSKDITRSWDTLSDVGEQGKYSMDEYYCRGSDKRGHSGQMALRLPPEVWGVMEELFQLRVFPYKTVQDLVRDAIVHRVYYLKAVIQSDRVDQSFAQLMNIQVILKRQQDAQEYGELLKQLDTIVPNLIAKGPGGESEAAKMIKEIVKNIESMPEGFWRREYYKEITLRYGNLIQSDHASHVSVERLMGGK